MTARSEAIKSLVTNGWEHARLPKGKWRLGRLADRASRLKGEDKISEVHPLAEALVQIMPAEGEYLTGIRNDRLTSARWVSRERNHLRIMNSDIMPDGKVNPHYSIDITIANNFTYGSRTRQIKDGMGIISGQVQDFRGETIKFFKFPDRQTDQNFASFLVSAAQDFAHGRLRIRS